MTVHRQGIHDRIQWLLDLGREHAREFCTPEVFLARKRYLAKHPTLVAVMKCMDGRIHIPWATQTPLGIIQPFRNLGGIFDLGWPYLGEVLNTSFQNAVNSGRRVLLLITYHYSKDTPHRGCAGFDYNRDAAIEHTYCIKRQVEEIFGKDHQSVYPVVCGFETDLDALILHGEQASTLDLASVRDTERDELMARLIVLFPDMPRQVMLDLLPLIQGNIAHVAEMRDSDRELDIVHREWAICIGRGFDFFHVPNVALIVGPYSPDLSDPIRKAATIIRKNMSDGRIPDDGFLLLTSSPYQEIGVDRARATLKARFLSQFAADVIGNAYPDLHQKMVPYTAVLNWHTRDLEVI
jgi:hypothetical protein